MKGVGGQKLLIIVHVQGKKSPRGGSTLGGQKKGDIRNTYVGIE